MKKSLILGLFAIGVIFTSCGTMGGSSIKTDKDSVSYALGIDVATNLYNFDSTLNAEFNIAVLNAAIRDVFAKNPKMTVDQARSHIQIFMTKRQQEIFVEDSIKNDAASIKYMEEKVKEGFLKTESGILYKITQPGVGANTELGDTLSVHYTLSMPNGDKQESSLDNGEPMKFTNLEDRMIPGFTEGMTLLNKGAKATIVIPSELAYGRGRSGVGPCQALTFEIEMIEVIKPKK